MTERIITHLQIAIPEIRLCLSFDNIGIEINCSDILPAFSYRNAGKIYLTHRLRRDVKSAISCLQSLLFARNGKSERRSKVAVIQR